MQPLNALHKFFKNKFGAGCYASLKCCHERGTVNRAWQEKFNSYSLAGYQKNNKKAPVETRAVL